MIFFLVDNILLLKLCFVYCLVVCCLLFYFCVVWFVVEWYLFKIVGDYF